MQTPLTSHCTLKALTRTELIVTIGVLCALLAALVPFSIKTVERCCVSKHISHAKQIYLGLRMFAEDNNGAFPFPETGTAPFTNANQAYRKLLPNYILTEEQFSLPDSPWTPTPFDNKTPPRTPLAAGRNHWAYVPNLTDNSNPTIPLVAEGFKKGTPGVYDAHNAVKKGQYKGQVARVVIRVDGSGKFEFGSKEDYRIYGSNNEGEVIDIFKPAPNWLRPDQMPLNPEG